MPFRYRSGNGNFPVLVKMVFNNGNLCISGVVGWNFDLITSKDFVNMFAS